MENNIPEQTQELTIIDKSLEEFKQAGEVLRSNQSRAAKALAVGQKLLADWEANERKMTPELDTRMQNYLANCSAAKSGMNENRKAITQTLTMIAKAFTGEENKLDVTDKATAAYQIQQIRNAYAKQLHEEEQERQRQIQLQQQKDQEAINIKAECEKRLLAYTGKYLADEKLRINSVFNALAIDTFEAKSNALRNMQPVYPYSHFQQFVHGISSRLFTPAEIETMLKLMIEGKFTSIAEQYKAQVTELRDFLIDRLPSKMQELEAIKRQDEEMEAERKEQERIRKEQENANAEQRKKLEQEQKESQERQRKADEERQRIENEKNQREELERQRLAEEDRQRQAEQQQQVEQNKEVETTMSLFNTEVETAAETDKKPEVRQGYEITVTGTAGWMQIFQQWFNETGKGLDNEKISGTKMEAMKTFCEKLAHKDETKKIVSNFIVYQPSFKAVNRKVK